MFPSGTEIENWDKVSLLFHEGGRYHIETSPLICSANQWTGFCMIMASVMKELMAWISPLIFDKVPLQ